MGRRGAVVERQRRGRVTGVSSVAAVRAAAKSQGRAAAAARVRGLGEKEPPTRGLPAHVVVHDRISAVTAIGAVIPGTARAADHASVGAHGAGSVGVRAESGRDAGGAVPACRSGSGRRAAGAPVGGRIDRHLSADNGRAERRGAGRRGMALGRRAVAAACGRGEGQTALHGLAAVAADRENVEAHVALNCDRRIGQGGAGGPAGLIERKPADATFRRDGRLHRGGGRVGQGLGRGGVAAAARRTTRDIRTRRHIRTAARSAAGDVGEDDRAPVRTRGCVVGDGHVAAVACGSALRAAAAVAADEDGRGQRRRACTVGGGRDRSVRRCHAMRGAGVEPAACSAAAGAALKLKGGLGRMAWTGGDRGGMARCSGAVGAVSGAAVAEHPSDPARATAAAVCVRLRGHVARTGQVDAGRRGAGARPVAVDRAAPVAAVGRDVCRDTGALGDAVPIVEGQGGLSAAPCAGVAAVGGGGACQARESAAAAVDGLAQDQLAAIGRARDGIVLRQADAVGAAAARNTRAAGTGGRYRSHRQAPGARQRPGRRHVGHGAARAGVRVRAAGAVAVGTAADAALGGGRDGRVDDLRVAGHGRDSAGVAALAARRSDAIGSAAARNPGRAARAAPRGRGRAGKDRGRGGGGRGRYGARIAALAAGARVAAGALEIEVLVLPGSAAVAAGAPAATEGGHVVADVGRRGIRRDRIAGGAAVRARVAVVGAGYPRSAVRPRLENSAH